MNRVQTESSNGRRVDHFSDVAAVFICSLEAARSHNFVQTSHDEEKIPTID